MVTKCDIFSALLFEFAFHLFLKLMKNIVKLLCQILIYLIFHSFSREILTEHVEIVSNNHTIFVSYLQVQRF